MNKGLSLLGIAKKAGKLAAGNDQVEGALADGRARLIVYACDAAPNTLRRFNNKGSGIQHITVRESKEELGAVIGYNSCAVLAVCDSGLSKAFVSAYDSSLSGIKALEKQQSKSKD